MAKIYKDFCKFYDATLTKAVDSSITTNQMNETRDKVVEVCLSLFCKSIILFSSFEY